LNFRATAKAHPRLAVLLATGYEAPLGEAPGPFELISKPYERDDLLARVVAARDASAASDALDARRERRRAGALRRFAAWCMQSWSWWYSVRELSYVVTTHLGATSKPKVDAWAAPLFEAYCAGAWLLYWTAGTLYWASKPRVHVDRTNGRRRLHNATGAAVESAIERLYFWHGVMVPAFVVVRPDWITREIIDGESNAEVRRVMTERFGHERYLSESGAVPVHWDETGELYRIGDSYAVSVLNSTPGPNGSRRRYVLPVHPELRPMRVRTDGRLDLGEPQEPTARNAIASTFFLRGEEYAPCAES